MGRNMTKYFLYMVMILSCLFIAGCTIGEEYAVDPDGNDEEIPISGSLLMPVPQGLSITPTPEHQIEDLTGDVLITVGDKAYTIPSEDISLNDENTIIRVPLSVTVDFSGVVVITCMSRLYVGENPVVYAGYLMTVISEDDGLDLNAIDMDNDGYISQEEKEGPQFTPAVRSSSGAADDPAEILWFNLDGTATTDPVTTFDAQIDEMDWNLVYLGIKDQYDNIQYRIVEIADDDLQSRYSNIQDRDISLNLGTNEIRLFVVNSTGLTVSDKRTIVSRTDLAAGKENFLFTLTWDNLGDLDLHTWYFNDENSTSPEDTIWHNYWFYENVPTDDGDEVVNLDIDNQTGFGPEHFSLIGAADGYYVVAVNAFELNDNAPINAYVTLESNYSLKSYGPKRFTEEDADGDLSNPNALIRIADIKVENGRAEFLKPDTTITLTDFFGEADSVINLGKRPTQPPRN